MGSLQHHYNTVTPFVWLLYIGLGVRVSVSALCSYHGAGSYSTGSVVGVTDTPQPAADRVVSQTQSTASWPCMYSPVLHSTLWVRKRPIMSAGRRYVHAGWCWACQLPATVTALSYPVSSRPSGHMQLVCCDNDSGGLALAVSRRQILTFFVSHSWHSIIDLVRNCGLRELYQLFYLNLISYVSLYVLR